MSVDYDSEFKQFLKSIFVIDDVQPFQSDAFDALIKHVLPSESNVAVYYPFMPTLKPSNSDSVAITQIDDQNFVEFEIAPDLNIRYFLNYDPNLPEGSFVYDYFGSGELYFNPHKGTSIVAASSNWKNFVKDNFWQAENQSVFRIMPDREGIKYFHDYDGIVTSYYLPQSESYAWQFRDIQTFFYIADSVPVVQIPDPNTPKKFIPICKNYSYHDNDIAISSPKYKFANHIPGVPTCSHYHDNEDTSNAKFCAYQTDNQRSCLMYVPLINKLQTIEVATNNTNNKISIAVEHFESRTGYNVFTIKNETENTVINQIAVPVDVSYDDAVAEVNVILEEYVACYNDHTKQVKDHEDNSSDSIKEKNPFIQSLLV